MALDVVQGGVRGPVELINRTERRFAIFSSACAQSSSAGFNSGG